jgi:hypothetical protein
LNGRIIKKHKNPTKKLTNNERLIVKEQSKDIFHSSFINKNIGRDIDFDFVPSYKS